MKSLTAVCLLFVSVSAFADEPIIYTKTKYVFQEGDKSKDEDVRFRFEDSMLIIHDKKEPAKAEKVKFEIPYSDVTELTYERSKHPRAKTAILISPFALFSKGKKHWLYLQTKGEMHFFQMDKKEYQRLLMTLEQRTGVEVERIIEE